MEPPRPLKELLYLAVVLAVYLAGLGGLPFLEGEWARWARLVLPSAWLLLGSARPLARQRDLLRGGRHSRWMALGCGGATLMLVWLALLLRGEGEGPEAAVLLRGVLLALLVPLAEEAYFRGILLEHLWRNLGPLPALALVSGLFGVLHQPQGLALPMALLSAMLCLSVLLSRSILWATALHMGWNTAAVIYQQRSGGVALPALALAALTALVLRGVMTPIPSPPPERR